jgi:hypothetical protein
MIFQKYQFSKGGQMVNNFKKVVTIAAMSTIAVSAVVAVNPHQADAASNTEGLVVKAEQNKVILIRAISVDYNADAVKQPWTEYNKTKKDYAAAKEAVSKLSKKDRDRLNARLDIVKLWLDRTAIYIDAISSGKKLAGYQAVLEDSLAEGKFEEMTASYHKLSYEIKKQAAYLYKVYGQSTRQAILETYKLPAEEAKQNALYPVSIVIEIDRLVAALEDGNEELAVKYVTNIGEWFEHIDDDNLSEALINYFKDAVSPYLEDLNEEISSFEPYDNVTFPTGQADINAFEAFGFYNTDGEEIYSDAYLLGYIIKDEKGYFDEEGYLTTAFEETGLTELGTDKIQIINTKDNTVVAETVVQIVKGLPYYSLDKGKIVDASGTAVLKPVIGQTYHFVPTLATDQNFDTIGDDAGETLALGDFEGITFKSSNPQVFTVDANGNITAITPGKARLTVTYNEIDYTLLVEIVQTPAN